MSPHYALKLSDCGVVNHWWWMEGLLSNWSTSWGKTQQRNEVAKKVESKVNAVACEDFDDIW